MALATQADVEKTLHRELTDQEAEDVESQLDEASDLVEGYLICPPPVPTPEPIVRAVAAMVAAIIDRSKNTPENADTVTAGPYSQRFVEGSTAKGPWLTAALKMRLRPWRCSVRSVSLVSERFES